MRQNGKKKGERGVGVEMGRAAASYVCKGMAGLSPL